MPTTLISWWISRAILKTAGAEYTANVQSFTATANSSGDIVIAFTDGTANQPLIMGIEIR